MTAEESLAAYKEWRESIKHTPTRAGAFHAGAVWMALHAHSEADCDFLRGVTNEVCDDGVTASQKGQQE